MRSRQPLENNAWFQPLEGTLAVSPGGRARRGIPLAAIRFFLEDRRYPSCVAQIHGILDLRGELESPELFKDYQFIGLKDVFKNIEENKKDLSQRVVALKELVQRRAQEYFERTLHRPYGWEDLCI